MVCGQSVPACQTSNEPWKDGQRVPAVLFLERPREHLAFQIWPHYPCPIPLAMYQGEKRSLRANPCSSNEGRRAAEYPCRRQHLPLSETETYLTRSSPKMSFAEEVKRVRPCQHREGGCNWRSEIRMHFPHACNPSTDPGKRPTCSIKKGRSVYRSGAK